MRIDAIAFERVYVLTAFVRLTRGDWDLAKPMRHAKSRKAILLPSAKMVYLMSLSKVGTLQLSNLIGNMRAALRQGNRLNGGGSFRRG